MGLNVSGICFDQTDLLALRELLKSAISEQDIEKAADSFKKGLGQFMLDGLIRHVKSMSIEELQRVELGLKKYIVVGNTKCTACNTTVRGLAVVIDGGAEHIFCSAQLKPRTIKTETKEDVMTTKKLKKEKVKEVKIEPKIKQKTEKKTDVNKNELPYREGSKYAYVYNLLIKGISLSDLTKNLKEKFGSKTAATSNVRLYINTIDKKFKLDTSNNLYKIADKK